MVGKNICKTFPLNFISKNINYNTNNSKPEYKFCTINQILILTPNYIKITAEKK
jgi:hypothetical protein